MTQGPSILLLDNFDSFTHNLADYLRQLGVNPLVYRNNTPLSELTKLDIKGVILSPGPGKPKDAGCLMEAIQHFHDKLPILGICLGHQAIGEFFGAKLVKASKPMHGMTSVITHNQKELFKNIPPSFTVVRYHSLVLTDLPKTLEETAWSEEKALMGFRHKSLPLEGLQFHPESILSEFGMEILSNWLSKFINN